MVDETTGLHAEFTADSGQAYSEVGRLNKQLSKLGTEFVSIAGKTDKAEEANKRAARAMHRLRMQVDDLYASSQRYAKQVQLIDQMAAKNNWTEAQRTQAYERSALAIYGAGQSLERYNKIARTSRFHTANVAAQFNDIAVMAAAGQAPMMTAIQQGSQLSQVFASMGDHKAVIKGLGQAMRAFINPMTLATVAVTAGAAALIQWGVKAIRARDNTNEYKEALKDLGEVMDNVQQKFEKELFGIETVAELTALKQLQEVSAERAEIEQRINELEAERGSGYVRRVRSLRRELEGVKEREQTLKDELDALVEQRRQYDRIIEASIKLADQERKIWEGYDQAKNTLADTWPEAQKLHEELGTAAMRALNLARVDLSSPLSEAQKEAARLAGQLGIGYDNALGIVRAMDQGEELWQQYQQRMAKQTSPAGPAGLLPQSLEEDKGIRIEPRDALAASSSRRAGGGAAKPEWMSTIEQLRQSLLTQEEIELESYRKRREALEQFLQSRQGTVEEYNRLLYGLNSDHEKTMKMLQVQRQNERLSAYGDFFGAMAQVTQAGGERMFAISKAFAVGQAVISMWQAAAKALAAGFPQNIALWGQAIAMGMQAINGIRSAQPGGSTGGGGAVAAAPAASTSTMQAAGTATGDSGRTSQRVAIQLSGGDMFSRDQVIRLINEINMAVEDGAQIRVV